MSLRGLFSKWGIATKRAPSKSALEFCAKHEVSKQLVASLEASAFSNALAFKESGIVLYPFESLPAKNRSSANRPCLKHGFLVIGHGPTGDPVAIELSTAKVVFVEHGGLWDFDPEESSFETHVARTKLSIESFVSKAYTGKGPTDFYSLAESSSSSGHVRKLERLCALLNRKKAWGNLDEPTFREYVAREHLDGGASLSKLVREYKLPLAKLKACVEEHASHTKKKKRAT